MKRLAHLSDLHFGWGPDATDRCHRLRDEFVAEGVDHLVITGDITNRGRREELDAFFACFGPLLDKGMVSIVPGNHDRLGDDVRDDLMPGPRVKVRIAAGCYLVMVDSTGPHNRFLLAGHGVLLPSDLEAIEQALLTAPEGLLRVLMLHHHPLPLPEENYAERLSNWLGWPWAQEIHLGPQLVRRVFGHCDLILHGHRHTASETRILHESGRHLWVFNAGSSVAAERVRIFTHENGAMVGPACWYHFDVPRRAASQSARRARFSLPGRHAPLRHPNSRQYQRNQA